jgi:8-hydroxy-5-deazaflavin:NADPH oxidoreductase
MCRRSQQFQMNQQRITIMTTAIIGLGNMGQGLASRLGGQTDLVLATRDETEAAKIAANLPGTRAATVDAAISEADVVIFAVGYDAALALAARPDLAGKVVVDITNPVTPDYSGLRLGHTTSAAEEIARVAKGARVVKAFNTIFAGLFGVPRDVTASVPVFLAGDDAAAVDAVGDLAEKAGFRVERTGGLDAARLLEPLGMLNIRLGYGLGRGTAIAPTWTAIAA